MLNLYTHYCDLTYYLQLQFNIQSVFNGLLASIMLAASIIRLASICPVTQICSMVVVQLESSKNSSARVKQKQFSQSQVTDYTVQIELIKLNLLVIL